MTFTIDPGSLHKQITEAIGRTLSTRQMGETTAISLPIMYPSGAFAGAHVTVSGDRCYVSDGALGSREAELAGAGDVFDATARASAEWFGVGYDGTSLFVASAPLARIEGAIIAVANASARAVAHALLNASERKDRGRNSTLFDMLREFFGSSQVVRTASIPGKDASWDAHNVVMHRGKQSVFEYVSGNTNSIANKFLMFSDIGRMEDPPRLNSVIDAVDTLSEKGSMLSDVSNIVPITANREIFLHYADAA